jgi:hypothetical protein
MTALGRASLFVLSAVVLVLGASAGCSSDPSILPPVALGGASGAGSSIGGNATSGTSTSGSSSGGAPNGGSGVSTAGSGGAANSAGSGGSAGNAGAAGSGGAAGTGGAAGSGGTAGSAGMAGTGGTAGTGGSGGTGGCAILPVVAPLIYDFPPSSDPGAGGAGGAGGAPSVPPIEGFSFGYNGNPPTVFSGYSFFYPDTLESDIAEGFWHVSGSVGTYAGFQVGFVCGADASNYKGISFKISGNAGPSGSLSFVVAHAADVWRNPSSVEPTAAKCVAAAQYDGTCLEATATVPVTGAQTTVSLLWEDFKNGKPQMNPNPAELVALRWLFAWNANTTAYQVNVRLDDLTFLEK